MLQKLLSCWMINKLGSKYNIINYDMGEKCANTCSKNTLCKAFINDTTNKSCFFYDISAFCGIASDHPPRGS